MLDDASRTRRTDRPAGPRPADYVIATALVAIASISTYRLFDDGAAERTASAGPGTEEIGPARGAVR